MLLNMNYINLFNITDINKKIFNTYFFLYCYIMCINIEFMVICEL